MTTKKIARTKESRLENRRPKTWKREVGTDCYYGPQSQKPDLLPVKFEELKQYIMKKLFQNRENRQQIEQDTIGQDTSELWQSLRKEMLTASNFGMVCRMKQSTSCASAVKNIMYGSCVDTVTMKYGREMEEMARQDLASKIQKDIKKCEKRY